MVKWLVPLILLQACTSVRPLKYKYTSSKRYLASMTAEDVKVARIEISFRDPVMLATGMDATQMRVQLFDRSGNELLNVDPNDLTLSTNVDIEAKPFSLKQGVYKTEILPRVKSPSITMRVDWQGKILSKEAVLKMQVQPLKNELAPVINEFIVTNSLGEIDVARGSGAMENTSESFSIDNMGDNRIVNTSQNPAASRNYNFEYPEHARQNLQLMIDDAPTATYSENLHSLIMVFPRKQVWTVEQLSGTLSVTIPTGEKMIFSKNSKEIVDGVFVEGPVRKKTYPDLRYTGQGIFLRANGKGMSPQLDSSDSVFILNGSTGQKCQRPKEDFWEQIDVAPIEFKFPTDEEFDQYLKINCGFGIPKS